MTTDVDRLTADEFAAIWNRAETLDDAIATIRRAAGRTVPRWAVLARALADRRRGAELKRFPDPTASGGG
jgi:hypothetical protein